MKNIERKNKHAEVYTPEHLCIQMCDMVPATYWDNPKQKYLEPCCGNGAILKQIILKRKEAP